MREKDLKTFLIFKLNSNTSYLQTLFHILTDLYMTAFLFYWGKSIFTQNGEINYFYVWLFCGVPFGIRRMFLWLIPINHDFTVTAGIFAVNIIAGGLIGCIVIVWQLLVAAWYIPLTIYRLVNK